MNEELVVVIKAVTAEFKREMESATQEIKKMSKEGENLGKQSDKVSKQASDSIKKMGDHFDKLGAKIAKLIKVGVTALGTAIVAVGKKSLESYADYQQLTGGMETLFGNAYNSIMKNAANAYKNQQMSANEYMEMATTMSSSIIQSVGGDTEKAAQLVDLAISDMADNANKMGSSMESVQNAYRGLMMGNYTMLDNLKLGYKGTREETERLLADAEKLTGIHYDIDDGDDVILAIHAIQVEMGMTGTAAEEAATTVSGSVAMMKASWENWLVALTDPDGNVEEATQQLLESVGTVIDNIKPLIGEFFEGLKTGIHEALSGFPELQSAFDDICNVIEFVIQVISGLVSFVVENWETMKWVIAGVSAALGILVVAVQAYNTVMAIKKAVNIAETASMGAVAAATWAALAPYLLIAAAIDAVIAAIVLCIKYWDEICETVERVWNSIKEWVVNGVENVVEWLHKLDENTLGVIRTIIEAIAGFFKDVWNFAKRIVEPIINAVKTVIQWFIDLKTNIENTVEKIKTTVHEKFEAVREKIVTPVEKAKNKVKEIIDKLKSFFHFEWSLPKLKLPHVVITGHWSLNPPSYPKFDLQWYAKGGVFDTPTLFSYGGGIGGLGEAGAEAVVPLEKNTEWLDKIAERLSGSMAGTPIVLQVDGKTFAQTSISCINDLTSQTGRLGLNIM